MLAWAVAALRPVCGTVVVAGPPDLLDAVRGEVPNALVVAGGTERSDSVRAALAAVPRGVEHVLVHDAARPMAPVDLGRAVLRALRAGARAVVPVLPVADTVKIVDEAGWVTATPDRRTVRIVQTPQGFERELLERAHAGGADATDDAGLIERLGVRVFTVPGDPAAAKVTVAADLEMLSRLVTRVGGV